MTRLGVVARCLLVLLIAGCQSSGSALQTGPKGYGADDPSVPVSRYQSTRWKAILVAGDHSIAAFDNAVVEIASVLRARRVDVVATFSAAGTARVPGATLATIANLDRWASTFRVRDGEGCLVFATSHGTVHGLRLTKDPHPSQLQPAELNRIVTAACGDAPTVIVVSACHSGTFIRETLVTPNRIMLSAARDIRRSFGCRPERRFTYYDGCLLQEFPKASTWEALHAAVSQCIVAKEAAVREPASEPQAFFGRNMKQLSLPGR